MSVSQAHADAAREVAEYRELLQAIHDALDFPPSTGMVLGYRVGGVRGAIGAVLKGDGHTLRAAIDILRRDAEATP